MATMSNIIDGDDSNDIWDEDSDSDCLVSDFLSDSLVLEREWERRHNQFHTIGYRDGITAGKEASVQDGFNDGYKESIHAGYCWGLVRGISSAISSFSDQLKETLAINLANKDRFQVLLESTQAISSNDALQIFYRSIPQNGCGSSDVEDGSDSQLETLFSELNHLLNNSPDIKVDLGRLKELVN